MQRAIVFSCVVAAGFATLAAAADKPVLAPPPAWVIPADAAADLPPSDNAPVQILLNDQQVRLTAADVETYVANRMLIQSPQGLGMLGTLRFSWNPDTDVMTVHRLTATRDGVTRNLLESVDGLTILRREDQLEEAVLTGTLTAVLQPPGLAVGDVIDIAYSLNRRDPVIADSPNGMYAWPNTPVARMRFRALWPDKLSLQWKASPQMPKAESTRREGWNEVMYQAENPAPLLQPTGAPMRFMALRTLELTAFESWPDVSRRFAPLYRKAATLAPDSSLKAHVARIRSQYSNDEDRAAAALRLVQDDVRYVLLAMNDGGLVPATADETWQRRFGDCKAKTVLLMALLDGLGIKAEPVAVSTSLDDGLDARLPAIALFDHVLVRARIDGKDRWLDGTRMGDRTIAQAKPPALRWGLPLTSAGSELVALPLEPLAEPDSIRKLDIDASKGLGLPAPFRAEMIARGDGARALRLTLDAVPVASREEGLKSFWREQYNNLEILKTETRFDEQTGVLTWSATGTISMEWDDRFNTYEPAGMSMGWRADFNRPAGTDASVPYAVDFPVYTRVVETIRLPEQSQAFTLQGTDIDQTVAGRHFLRKARLEKDRFTAESTYRSLAPEFPASETKKAAQVLLEMSNNTLHIRKPVPYVLTAEELLAQADEPLDTAREYVTRAFMMMSRNMPQQAMSAFDKAVELEPRNIEALWGRGQARSQRGLYAEARLDAEAGLAVKPDDARLQQLLASVDVSQGNAQAGIDRITPLIGKDPTSFNYVTRARAYALLKQNEAALADADSATRAKYPSPDAWMFKAHMLDRLGRDGEIPAVMDELLESPVSNPTMYVSAANLLVTVGNRQRAKEVLDAGLDRSPDVGGYLYRASIEDDSQRAKALLASAVALDGSSSSRLGAANVQIDRKRYSEALSEVEASEKLHGVSTRSAVYRGIAQWHLGDRDGAATAFTQARNSVKQPMELNNACWEKATANVALEDALKDCDAALSGLPDCAACKDSRGFALLRLGRYEEAIAAYDDALRLRPYVASSLQGRGIARLRLGQKERGEQDLMEALDHGAGIAREFEGYGVKP
jgi:tetratricopeptide (TPR) repeat protein